jgi:hypothetical protein
MPEQIQLPGYHWFRVFKNVPVRVGLYTGLCLSFAFAMWIVIANRMPALEQFAQARNVSAVVALCFLSAIPAVRFYRDPWGLLASGLLAWTLLSITYRGLCLVFVLLGEKYGTFHIFALGAVVYLICATLSWIGTMIWRVHLSQTSDNHH